MVDKDLPAVFFYKNGDLSNCLMGARQIFGASKMNMKTVEFVLSLQGVINMKFDYDPRDKLKLINTTIVKGKNAADKQIKDRDEEDSGEDDREYVSN